MYIIPIFRDQLMVRVTVGRALPQLSAFGAERIAGISLPTVLINASVDCRLVTTVAANPRLEMEKQPSKKQQNVNLPRRLDIDSDAPNATA